MIIKIRLEGKIAFFVKAKNGYNFSIVHTTVKLVWGKEIKEEQPHGFWFIEGERYK